MKKFSVLGIFIAAFVVLYALGTVAQSIADQPKPPEPPKSSMVAPTLYSETLKLDWNYTAYLPVGYDAPENANKTYPVIYLLHGAYGNHRNLVERFPVQKIIDDLIAAKELPESIVVFTDGFNSYYVNGPALDMEDAFVKDLFPTIESTYRVDAKKEKRIIGGISMGGFGAARFALKYPDLFNSALLISPAVWEAPEEGNAVRDKWHVFPENGQGFSQAVWESFYPQGLIEGYKAANSPVNFFLISGDADKTVDPSVVTGFGDKLSAVTSAETVIEKDGVHAWTYWEGATKKALAFAGQKLQ